MATTIYRVEDAEGYGPFRYDSTIRAMARAALGVEKPFHVSPEFPPPSGDPALRYFWRPGVHLSGTSSASELDHWFPAPVREVLSGGSFQVRIYEVPDEDVVLGETQAIFVRDRAKLIEAIPMNTFQVQ